MLLSVYARAYPGTVIEQVTAAAGDGFEAIELRGAIDNIPLTRYEHAAYQEVFARAADLGLTVATLALGHADEHRRDPDGLHRVGAAAAAAGARVRLFSSLRAGIGEPDQAWGEPADDEFAAEVDHLGQCVEHLRAAGGDVPVMVEGEPTSIGNTVRRQARLIAATGLEIGHNWDYVNGWMAGEYPWPEPWPLLEGRLLGVHFKCARADAIEPARYASQTVPANDDLPQQAMWTTWAASGFYGPVTVDPAYHAFALSDRFVPTPEHPAAVIARKSLAAMKVLRERAMERIGWTYTQPR